MTTQMGSPAALGTRILRLLADAAALTRFEVTPVLASPFLLGALCYGHAAVATSVAWAALGCALHAFGCAVNDLADRQVDALDPRRASRPLTSGRLTPGQAMKIIVILAITYLVGVLVLAPSAAAVSALVAIALVTGWGNTVQKRSSIPSLIFDLLFGITVAVPLLIFAGLTHASALGAAASLALVFMLSDVAGSDLKDLAADTHAQVRTSAIMLGLTPSPTGATTSRRFRAFCRSAYALIAGLSMIALATADATTLQWLTALAGLAVGTMLMHRYTATRALRRGASSLAFLNGPLLAWLCVLAAVDDPATVAAGVAATLATCVTLLYARRLVAVTAQRLEVTGKGGNLQP